MQFREVRSKLEAAIPDRQGGSSFYCPARVGRESLALSSRWMARSRASDRCRVSTAKDVQSCDRVAAICEASI